MSVDVSIVIACYNEEPHLVESIAVIEDVLSSLIWSYELIFVEDCSTDKTKFLIQKLVSNNPKYKAIYHEKNEGRGKTVCDGILNSNGRVVGFLDIDLEVHARYLSSLIDPILKNKCDVSIAYRIYNVSLNPYILIRHFFSHGYRWLTRHLINLKVKDSEAGFKFFNREKIMPLINKSQFTGWFWDTEIMALSEKAHLKIQEINVLFLRRPEKVSTVNLLTDSIKSFKELLKFKKALKKSFQNYS